jgi:hypothetical protein
MRPSFAAAVAGLAAAAAEATTPTLLTALPPPAPGPAPTPPPCRQLKLNKGGESSEKDYSFSLWIPQEFQVGEGPRTAARQEAGRGQCRLAGGCRGWHGRRAGRRPPM